MNGKLRIVGLGAVSHAPAPPEPAAARPFAWVDPGVDYTPLPCPVAAGYVEDAVETVLNAARAEEITYLGPGAPAGDDPVADALVRRSAERSIELELIEAEPLWWRHRPTGVPFSVQSEASLESADLSVPALVLGLIGHYGLRQMAMRAGRRSPAVELTVIPWNGPTFQWRPAKDADALLPSECHPCAILVAPLAPTDDARSMQSLISIVARLRAPDGCPWDREQTHASLRRFMIEEAYEAVEAIDSGDGDKLAGELGDVLVQVALHAQIASEAGDFAFGDVVASIIRKLIRRHPHVFGDVRVKGTQEVLENWERIKSAERGHQDFLDGIPASLPALIYAREAIARAARFEGAADDRQSPPEPLAAVDDWLGRHPQPDREAELGRLLFALVGVAGRFGLDPEAALSAANRRFRERVSSPRMTHRTEDGKHSQSG